MNFSSWLRSLPGSPTPTTAARRSGLVDATLIRHAEKGVTTADNIIKIAKAYGIHPIDALVDLGFLESSDVAGARVSLRRALEEASVSELLEYLVKAVNASGMFDGDFSAEDLLDSPSADVIQMPSQGLGAYAADGSDTEPEEGDDEYGGGA